MADEAGEKTEEATQARREEFRNRGQVAQTKELASALFLFLSALGIYFLGKFFFQHTIEVFNSSFGPDMVAQIRLGDYRPALKSAAIELLIMLAPVFGIVFILGIASSVLQVGILQIEDALTPKLEKMDPIQGLTRMFSLRSLVEGLKSLIKIIIIGTIVYFILKSEIVRIPWLMQYPVGQLFEYMGFLSAKLFGSVAVLMTVLAAADYFYQRWDLEKQMMMTKQEVKEEHKSREGDPHVKGRIRKIQRDIASKRMMAEVPKADVIITNPTHIAIAVRYGSDVPAPQIIAKGADLVAEKIKAIAREHNIPVVENKPLARTIFKTLKIGQVIPRELYVAVAEVLSYVYKLKKKKVIN